MSVAVSKGDRSLFLPASCLEDGCNYVQQRMVGQRVMEKVVPWDEEDQVICRYTGLFST